MEKICIEMNTDMTLILAHVRDKITAKIVMGTGDDIDENDVVKQYNPKDETSLLDYITENFA